VPAQIQIVTLVINQLERKHGLEQNVASTAHKQFV